MNHPFWLLNDETIRAGHGNLFDSSRGMSSSVEFDLDETASCLPRGHPDVNVLCVTGRFVGIVSALTAPFDVASLYVGEEERTAERVIAAMISRYQILYNILTHCEGLVRQVVPENDHDSLRLQIQRTLISDLGKHGSDDTYGGVYRRPHDDQ